MAKIVWEYTTKVTKNEGRDLLVLKEALTTKLRRTRLSPRKKEFKAWVHRES